MTDDPIETERERIERDKQRLEDDLERFEQARERQRQTLRQREQEREEERARDREEFRERERRRAAETARDQRTYAPRYNTVRRSVGPGPGLVLQDLGRLAYAWVRTGVETAIGINKAIGNLALNLTDSIWGRHPESATAGVRETYGSQTRYEYADSYDYGGRGTYSTRGDYRTRRVRIDDCSLDAPSIVSDLSIGLSNAVRQTAEAISRSAENFSRVFEEETASDDVANEFNEPFPPPPASTVTGENDALSAKEPRKPLTDEPIR